MALSYQKKICPFKENSELIKMNIEAVFIICWGLPALNKKRMGLKKIPPPIPTIPEIKPNKEPINKETIKGIFL